jgi:quercetin dioxygenase-like cupin family protein
MEFARGDLYGDGEMKAGDELENARTGERLVVQRGSEDTNGEHLVGDLFVAPGGRVALPHYHPSLEERFEVVAGRIGFLLDGREQIGEPGKKIVVPPRTVHDWWNAGDTEVHVLGDVRGPVHRFERMLETFWGLGSDGKTNRKGVPNLLQLAVLMSEYDDVMRLVKPPRIVQKLLFGALAPLGRLFGYRSWYPEYAATPADRASAAGSGAAQLLERG